ncbi:MAG TPA: type II secretion system F family protein [Xanthobacteraceae bacterium]|nr:type II secretion system F family protein [Xanthobacteraceae bacterium]
MLGGTLPVAFLVTLAVGGVAYVFLFPLLSGEKRAEQRMKEIATETVVRKTRKPDAATSRRQQVEDTLKQLEERQKKAKRPPLSVRLQQSGLGWSKQRFFIVSAALGLFAGTAGLFLGAHIYVVPLLALAAAFGLPRWFLSYMKKRREQKFIDELPNAVDVIVRGVKSGLPVGDCIRIIASETKEPVKSEFRQIAESASMGIPLAEASAKLYDRVPLAEANFFSIVLSIQSKAGGSLSETLGNLSRVLRDRKKMAEKIKAMSMEAKASAMIIGALPGGVMLLVYLTSPQYIELLWTTSTGRMMLFASACWMGIGVLVMKKMINFDF